MLMMYCSGAVYLKNRTINATSRIQLEHRRCHIEVILPQCIFHRHRTQVQCTKISFHSQEFVMSVSQWLVLSKGDQMKEEALILLKSIYAASTNISRFW